MANARPNLIWKSGCKKKAQMEGVRESGGMPLAHEQDGGCKPMGGWMMRNTSDLRYLPAHHVAHESTSLGGFDVCDVAGDALGILDGFVVDSTARRVSYFVVEGLSWAVRRRFLIPIQEALMDAGARTLRLDVRGCKRFARFDPAEFPLFSEDDLVKSAEMTAA
jgi:hypothetical protein